MHILLRGYVGYQEPLSSNAVGAAKQPSKEAQDALFAQLMATLPQTPNHLKAGVKHVGTGS